MPFFTALHTMPGVQRFCAYHLAIFSFISALHQRVGHHGGVSGLRLDAVKLSRGRLRLAVVLDCVFTVVGFRFGDFLVSLAPSQRNSEENLLNVRLVLCPVVDLGAELISNNFHDASS